MGTTKKLTTTAPGEWEFAPEHFRFCDRVHLDEAAMVFETDCFLDYHRAKGSRFADWNAAWRNWMRRVEKYSARRTPPASYRERAMQESFAAIDRITEAIRREQECDAIARGLRPEAEGDGGAMARRARAAYRRRLVPDIVVSAG